VELQVVNHQEQDQVQEVQVAEVSAVTQVPEAKMVQMVKAEAVAALEMPAVELAMAVTVSLFLNTKFQSIQ
jgi:hypothetical protein